MVADDRGGRQMKYRPGGRYLKYHALPGLSWRLDRACTAMYRLWISEAFLVLARLLFFSTSH